MVIEHIAIWTTDLERLKSYYEKYFNATSNNKYFNPTTGLETYFLSFQSGSRLEIMYKPNVSSTVIAPENIGFTHLAFGVDTMQEVDQKAKQLLADGYLIIRGPRKTGDGYYEFETHDPEGNKLEVATLFCV